MCWGMGTGNMKIEIRYSLLGVPFYNPLFIIRNVVKNDDRQVYFRTTLFYSLLFSHLLALQ